MGHIHPARIEHPELNERELSYITLHTNFTRKQINDFYIRFLSRYPRGSLNFDQFCDLYSSELKHLKNSRPLLERLFDHIDTDKSGQLNFKEILFFKAITMPQTDQHEKLRWIFLLYDVNNDYRIDRNEFYDLYQLAYQVQGQQLTQERLKEMKNLFEQYDADRNGQLELDEFIQLCQKCTAVLQMISPMFTNTKWNSNKISQKNRCFTSDELTDERIDYLMRRTKFSRAQILHYYQIFRTRCQSNRLSIEEFVNFYQKLIQSNCSETYCEYLFRAFDSISKDGFIQFDEFLLAIYIHSNSSTPREKLEWLFNAYDRDGNELIDYNEVNQIVHALFILHDIDREKHSVAYVAYEIMATLDLNDDDRISKQEFNNLLKDKELMKFLAPTLVKQE